MTDPSHGNCHCLIIQKLTLKSSLGRVWVQFGLSLGWVWVKFGSIKYWSTNFFQPDSMSYNQAKGTHETIFSILQNKCNGNGRYVVRKSTVKVKISKLSLIGKIFGKEVMLEMPRWLWCILRKCRPNWSIGQSKCCPKASSPLYCTYVRNLILRNFFEF